MTILLSTLLLGLSTSLWAAEPERPTVPPPGVDKVLTKGETPRAFFQKRMADAGCQSELKAAKKAFRDLIQEVADMRAAKETDSKIDAKGGALMDARMEVLRLMELCGECATREIEVRTLDFKAGRETWFISDGSCQLPIETTNAKGEPDAAGIAKLQTVFQLVSDSLVHAKQYAGPNGGFDNVLAFHVINGNKIDPKADLFPSPANLAIWVRGPRILNMMMYYPMEAEYETVTKGSLSEFNLKFKSFEPKAKIVYPNVTDFTPSGKPVPPLINLLLRRVVGRWYITSDGYFRYFTAAMLPLNLTNPELMKQGRSVLTDTLTELSYRGQWE